MIFTYGCWDAFCRKLHDAGVHSVTARSVAEGAPKGRYIVLKHDVETNVDSALRIAAIEHSHGHYGSYYVQAYLLEDEGNVKKLQQMQAMGHEISYHYDVMDSNKGDIEAATVEFDRNLSLFEKNGFVLKTLCQHGNPVVERVGYASNRDFFRNQKVGARYPGLSDIMVDFKQKANTDYLYFSDAGRKFKLIFDPINNDIVSSDDKNIPFDNLDLLLDYINKQNQNAMISIHPHRWVTSKAKFIIKTAGFKVIRAVAKFLMKIPFMKRIMSKYYYLAKKI